MFSGDYFGFQSYTSWEDECNNIFDDSPTISPTIENITPTYSIANTTAIANSKDVTQVVTHPSLTPITVIASTNNPENNSQGKKDATLSAIIKDILTMPTVEFVFAPYNSKKIPYFLPDNSIVENRNNYFYYKNKMVIPLYVYTYYLNNSPCKEAEDYVFSEGVFLKYQSFLVRNYCHPITGDKLTKKEKKELTIDNYGKTYFKNIEIHFVYHKEAIIRAKPTYKIQFSHSKYSPPLNINSSKTKTLNYHNNTALFFNNSRNKPDNMANKNNTQQKNINSILDFRL